MRDRVLEVSASGAALSLRLGQVAVRPPSGGEATVPIEDLCAVVLAHPVCSVSHALLSALAEAGICVVTCDDRYRPASMLLPLAGHHVQTQRFLRQAEAGLPLRKRLWQQVVRAKIRAQASALAGVGVDPTPLLALAPTVRSGDSTNVEAVAARRYWPLMMGEAFRRDPDLEDANKPLNYGYAVLRAAVARAVVAAGLHPTLGLHHHNRFNPFCLADDLMEPFRPRIDTVVRAISNQNSGPLPLGPETKATLIDAVLGRRHCEGESRTLTDILQRVTHSLAAVYLGESSRLWLPEST